MHIKFGIWCSSQLNVPGIESLREKKIITLKAASFKTAAGLQMKLKRSNNVLTVLG